MAAVRVANGVMPGTVPGIHVSYVARRGEAVDGPGRTRP